MSVQGYPEYKGFDVAWVASIPAHWRHESGRRLFEERRDRALENDAQLSASQKYGVVPQSQLMEAEDQKVTLALGGTGNFKHVDRGDFVISLRSFQGGIEYSAFAGCVSPAYTVLRPRHSLESRYWVYLLKSDGYVSALQAMTEGIRDGKNISYEQFGQIALPFPPGGEQSAIAAFLDRETGKIDALVAEQERLIALLKEKRQAAISHAVTKGVNPDAPMKPSGIEWLGDVPEHWEVGPLKRFWSVTDCKHLTAEFVTDGIPLASIREVQARYVSLDHAKRTTEIFYEQLIEGGRQPLPGDLIFSRNATVGEVAQVPSVHERFAMGQDVCLLRKRQASFSSDYMQYVIGSLAVSEQLNELMIGSTFKRVNVEQIRTLLVPSPASGEQEKIAAWLESELARLDGLVTEASRAISLLKERRSTLISAAVTGQIDVRGLAS